MKKRKRYSAAIVGMSICLLLLGACGNIVSGNTQGDQNSTSSSGNSSATQDRNSVENSGKVADEPVGEMVQAGDLGDYYVEIKGATLAEDYNGEPAVVITYSWTNNSSETTSAMLSINEQAFQDGVELESALIMNSDIYDSGASMKDVRPGTTIDIQCAFLFANQTSDVEVELSELFNFSKNVPKVVNTYGFE